MACRLIAIVAASLACNGPSRERVPPSAPAPAPPNANVEPPTRAAGIASARTAPPEPTLPSRRPGRMAIPDIRPRTDATRRAWDHANQQNTAAAWDAAAAAFEVELAACRAECRDPAWGAFEARRKAAQDWEPPDLSRGPATPSTRTAAFLAAADAFVLAVGDADPYVPGTQLIAAAVLINHGQPEGIARLEALLRAHRDSHPTAMRAASLLLDALEAAGRIDEMRAWIALLRADDEFVQTTGWAEDLDDRLARLSR